VKRALAFFPAVSFAALIFFLSSQPQLPEPPLAFEGIDKVLHAATYAVLAMLLRAGAGTAKGAWWWAVVAAVYGATDELHQSFVPGRSADLLDLLADTAGSCLGIALWLKLAALPPKGTLDARRL
jgi:VanZ family protein